MTSEELRYKDKGYNADRQHRDGVTMRTGGGCKANKYNRYKLSSASSCKKNHTKTQKWVEKPRVC